MGRFKTEVPASIKEKGKKEKKIRENVKLFFKFF